MIQKKTSTKLANIIFNKKIDYYKFYGAFIVNNLGWYIYEENYQEFGEKLTQTEFYTLLKVGRKLYNNE